MKKLTLTTLVLAALAIAPASASAGSYTVYQCHGGAGYANSGWTAGWNGFAHGLEGCTNAFRMTATGKGAGQYLWFSTPTMPANLRIANLSFTSASSTGGGSTRLYARFCTAGAVVWGICAASNAVSIADGTRSYSLSCGIGGPNGECQRAMFHLQTADGGNHAANGNFFFYDLAFTLRDDSGPDSVTPHNGTLRTTANTQGERPWNRAQQTISVFGTDSQGGVRSLAANVDGTVPVRIDVPNASCNFTNWQPCPYWHGSNISFATESLTDGRHTVNGYATDAAGNVTASTATFFTDNNAPQSPNGIVTTTSGDPRATSGQFDVSWANGEEVDETDSHSGIAQVIVDVEPAQDGQPNPDPVRVPVGEAVDGVSATTSTARGIRTPSRGSWKLRIALEDKLGNRSEFAGPVDLALPAALDNGSGGDPSTASIALSSSAKIRTGYNKRKAVAGRLVDAAGTPIAGARLDVFDQVNVAGAKRRKVAVVTTDQQGRFSYRPTATASRRIVFAYAPASGASVYTATHTVNIYVSGGVRLRPSARRIAFGAKLKLYGSIRAKGMRRGVLVEIQVRGGGKWNTVATRRSNRRGAFKYTYRFSRAGGTYQFRARVRKNSDLPIEAAASRAVKVAVR